MKASHYNLLIPEAGGKSYLLHNTMYGATLRFDRNVAVEVEALLKQPGRLTNVEGLRETLIREKFFVDDSIDELQVLRVRRRQGIEDVNRYDVVMMLTQDCNFRCRYCYEEHKSSLMDEATGVAVSRWLESIIPRVKVL